MFTESLAGTWKGKVDRFLFLVHGAADEWPEDVKDLPKDSLLEKMQSALKEADHGLKLKVALAEAVEGDAEGDVLVFPGGARYNIRDGCEPLMEALRAAAPAACAVDVEDSHVFVCAHTKRDARCGHCGPRLIEAVKATGSSARVRKCSHVGGHAYAGNVLVFQGASSGGEGDFYGYVTPGTVGQVLSGKARRGRLWRGAMGLTPEQATQARKAQVTRDRVATAVLVAAGATALLWLYRWRQQQSRPSR